MRWGLCKCAFIERENDEEYCRLKFVVLSWDKTKAIAFTYRVYSKEETKGIEKGTRFNGTIGKGSDGQWEVALIDEL